MPPTNDEILEVQYDLVSKLALAEPLIKKVEEAATNEGRQLSEEERRGLMNSSAFAVVAKERALLRLYFDRMPESDWENFRKAAQHNDEVALAIILNNYEEFQQHFRTWVANWIGAQDPDAVTALTEALEGAEYDPENLNRIQAITETLVEELRQQLEGIVE